MKKLSDKCPIFSAHEPEKTDAERKQLQDAADWSLCEVSIPIPEQGVEMIRFGVILYGKGQVWLDDVQLEAV